MATRIRPELSSKNKYWIDRHRYYELKHFCLQYPIWKSLYTEFSNPDIPLSMIERIETTNIPGDPTEKRALLRVYFAEKIDLIEKTAKQSDPYIWEYIVKGVTEGMSYTKLKSKHDIPCGRDMYYDRYRKFFWLLSKERN